jgi:hypothetical protein
VVDQLGFLDGRGFGFRALVGFLRAALRRFGFQFFAALRFGFDFLAQ